MSASTPVHLELPPDEMRIPFEADETIYFASSSGHCNLDCSYCIVHPVIKHQPSLTLDDLRFLLDRTPGRAFFIFSGKGDFFAGYRRDDRLLARLLGDPRVGGVALDINGVVIHCLEDLTPEQWAKVRHLNLTLHHRQLVSHKALKVWRRNALTLLERADPTRLFVNTILSPPESAHWDEALAWYRSEIHAVHPKKIILIQDVERPFDDEARQRLKALLEVHGDLVLQERSGGFAPLFAQFDHVTCRAGSGYFRVWNDGQVDACPNISTLQAQGDVKRRTIHIQPAPVDCSDVRHCDCYHVASAGQMTFLKRPAPPGAR